MKTKKLAGLEPESLFAYFEKLCSIPHGSGNTRQISDYFVSFAKEHGLRYIQDEANNVILFKDASAGYEDHPPVILQSHMDMVCQKEEGCTIDMEKEPVDVTHDGKNVYAKGTSLGADDGAGIALCLNLLTDDTLAHPPLEVIFTADEEIGLIGANKLDLSMLKGRRMINLDGATEGRFVAGCAGGTRLSMEMPLQKAACADAVFSIRLDDFHGGHSGGLIHRNFANANQMMGQLLQKLQKNMDLRIVSFAGGTAGNAIPKGCVAQIAAEASAAEQIEKTCQAWLQELKQTYDEPAATVQVRLTAQNAGQAYTADSSNDILALLEELPNGMQTRFEKFNIAHTSLNMGITKTDETFYIHFAVRSNANDSRNQLLEKLHKIAEKYGCSYQLSGMYSAWEYREDSPLRQVMTAVFEQLRGRPAAVSVTHAGLECGTIGEKLPGLDCICTGTTMRYIHTAAEELDIASFGRTYEYLVHVLKAL